MGRREEVEGGEEEGGGLEVVVGDRQMKGKLSTVVQQIEYM